MQCFRIPFKPYCPKIAKSDGSSNTTFRLSFGSGEQHEFVLMECYYKCLFWPNLVKEFQKVSIYAVFLVYFEGVA